MAGLPLAPLCDRRPEASTPAGEAAGITLDYVFRSIQTDDKYHRRGFEVPYRYPGEGVADLAALTAALRRGLGDGAFFLTVEGLDNRAEVDDQRERLAPSLAILRSLDG